MWLHWRLVVVFAIALQAATCGQRGPLTLPDKHPPEQVPPASAPVP